MTKAKFNLCNPSKLDRACALSCLTSLLGELGDLRGEPGYLAARIRAGSAFASAFTAAARSPVAIASSTVRTAPRIWVRRDLLTAVRRAILRVAFLAEVVLAMVSISFAGTGRVLVG